MHLNIQKLHGGVRQNEEDEEEEAGISWGMGFDDEEAVT
jgi:hypothetical protein